MHLDRDLCFQASRSRDARFDGRFFIAVRTTGIYCRPICPARPPLRENVTYYPHAAAAEAAGYRACRRCRPDAAPSTPAWSGTAAAVTRALRLIDEGALDQGDVEELARRVGMGSRHLRRLFLTHVGAVPIVVAQTRRIHLARTLVETTTLPITQIALGSGFASLRRFNASFLQTYGLSPSRLRSKRRPVRNDRIELRLAYRPPLIAKNIGRPQSVRAVGAANGANPLPIVVPCHRVIGSNGSLTGFGGGLAVKQQLLALESGTRTLWG